jgi:hypothetical protein
MQTAAQALKSAICNFGGAPVVLTLESVESAALRREAAVLRELLPRLRSEFGILSQQLRERTKSFPDVC